MRILLIAEGFRAIGGVQEVVDNLAAEFDRLGHAVAIASTPAQSDALERIPRSNAQCFLMPIPSSRPITLRHPERLLRWSLKSRAAELIRCIRESHPDIVNSHVWGWDKFPAVVTACRAADAALVFSLYDSWGRGKTGERALDSIRHARALIALSESTKRFFERLIPAAHDTCVITGGVDCEAARNAIPYHRARPYILSVARIDFRHKAIDALILALAILAADFPEVDLLISGDGPDRKNLEELILAKGLGNRVQLLGIVPRDELWSLYKGALFFAMPSRLPEGLGLIFLEAMASGLAVIGTRSGGTPEIVTEGENGLLVDRNEPGELALAMRKLICDPQARARMGECGRRLAQSRYSWDLFAQRYLEVYSSCLRQGAAGQR